MHDDIPETERDLFGPGCGCLAAILVSIAAGGRRAVGCF